MNNMYLLKFNNYYNRTFKKLNNINDYLQYETKAYLNVNFEPNDGLSATKTITNYDSSLAVPDYMVVTDDLSNIISRWFIIDSIRKNKTTYQLTLKRDTVADNYTAVVTAPMFIEKATLLDNDPMIYNKENMTFNQIKTDEILLKKNTNAAWIVGYMEKADLTENKVFNLKLSTRYDEEYTDINAWPYHIYAQSDGLISNTEDIHINCDFNKVEQGGINSYPERYVYSLVDKTVSISSTIYEPTATANDIYFTDIQNDFRNISASDYAQLKSTAYANLNFIADDPSINYNKLCVVDSSIYNIMKSYNNKTLKIGSSAYKVVVTETTMADDVGDWISPSGAAGIILSRLSRVIVGFGSSDITPAFSGKVLSCELVLQTSENIYSEATLTLTNNNVANCQDAPYNLFVMPYEDINVVSNSTYNIEKNVQLDIACQLASYGGLIYDLQLVPYCPLNPSINESGGSLYISGSDVVHSDIISNSDNKLISQIYWLKNSSTTFDIDTKVNITEPIKISNEVEFCRLCSPNYNGIFEFSPAKNTYPGKTEAISGFNVDLVLKPFSPYFHINPIFDNLYGIDFNDSRGLICGGDFSLPITTDQWKTYQLNNKNYQQIFDRQISNMETNHKIDMTTSHIEGITNSIAGSVFGASIGGAGMGVLGGLTGAADAAVMLATKQAQYKETLDYTKDQFGFQLGNIQAQPDSLTKVSSFNPNNKIFPFIEKYKATQKEIQALKDKLYYNGMTVGRIDRIVNFIREEPSYIKGKLIKIENADIDFHEANDIAKELDMGLFI